MVGRCTDIRKAKRDVHRGAEGGIGHEGSIGQEGQAGERYGCHASRQDGRSAEDRGAEGSNGEAGTEYGEASWDASGRLIAVTRNDDGNFELYLSACE